MELDLDDDRFNEAGSILGQRGTGKTLYLLGSETSSNPKDKPLKKEGLLDVYIEKEMKSLIIDTLDHPSYRNIPILDQHGFFNFKKGLGRVILEPDDIMPFIDLINRSPHMNNTFIVGEDAGKWSGGKLQKPLKRLMIDTKQRNVDLVLMYHCFLDTPSDLFTKTDFVRLFKTEDSPDIRADRMRLSDKVFEAYETVKNHPNNFYSKYVDTRSN